MRKLVVAVAGAGVSLVLVGVAAAADKPAAPVKGVGSVELADPAGDVHPIESSGGSTYPAPDVVKLYLKSDGKDLTVGTILKDEPGAFATSVVELFIDTDNKPQTGAKLFSGRAGFEYKAELDACADYADKSSACVGGSKAKPVAHFAAVGVERFKGASEFPTDRVVDSMGVMGPKNAPRSPIVGKTVEAKLSYADLGVKPGQAIRILAREQHPTDDGFFPEILLTLK